MSNIPFLKRRLGLWTELPYRRYRALELPWEGEGVFAEPAEVGDFVLTQGRAFEATAEGVGIDRAAPAHLGLAFGAVLAGPVAGL